MIIAVLLIALGFLVLIGYAFSSRKAPVIDLPTLVVSPSLNRPSTEAVPPSAAIYDSTQNALKEPASSGIVRPLAERAIEMGALGATVAKRVVTELGQTEPTTTRLPLAAFLRPLTTEPAPDAEAGGSFLEPLDNDNAHIDEPAPLVDAPVLSVVAPLSPTTNATTRTLPPDPRFQPTAAEMQQMEFSFEERFTADEIEHYGIYDQRIEATVTDLAASRERLRPSGAPPPPAAADAAAPSDEDDLALFLPPAWALPPLGTGFGVPNLPLPAWLAGLGFASAPVSGPTLEERIRAFYARSDEDAILALVAAYRDEPRTRNAILTLFPDQADLRLYAPLAFTFTAFTDAPIQTAFGLSLLAEAGGFDGEIATILARHWGTPFFALHATKALVDTRGLTAASEILQGAHLPRESYEPLLRLAIQNDNFTNEPLPNTGTLG